MKREEDWVIEALDVSYTYDGNDERALDGLNLKIRRGTKVAFMGGNGSGKSTFFRKLPSWAETVRENLHFFSA